MPFHLLQVTPVSRGTRIRACNTPSCCGKQKLHASIGRARWRPGPSLPGMTALMRERARLLTMVALGAGAC